MENTKKKGPERKRGEEAVVLATLVVQINGDVNLRVFVALLVLLMLRIEVHFAVKLEEDFDIMAGVVECSLLLVFSTSVQNLERGR